MAPKRMTFRLRKIPPDGTLRSCLNNRLPRNPEYCRNMCPENRTAAGKQSLGFLYLKSGGGHVSAAKSMARTLTDNYPDEADVHLFDPVPGTHRMLAFLLEEGYRIASMKLSGLWILIYDISRLPFVQNLWNYLTYLVIRKNLSAFLRDRNITKLVLFHFLLIKPVRYVLSDLGLSTPVITVVTDPFTAHPMWFSQKTMQTVVFSGRLKSWCVNARGMKESRVRVFSPVISSRFTRIYREAENADFKRKLGLDPEKKLVLLTGGGEGIPRARRLLRAWLHAAPEAGLALVCGKDEALKQALTKMVSACHRGGKNRESEIIVLGFIDFMPELMAASDLVIAKAGPATVFETLTAGKPLIIYGYIYGQERGNLDFILRRKAGFYMPKISSLAALAGALVTDLGRLEVLGRNSLHAKPASDLDALAGFIFSLNN
ncbi:MAG: hypothetical protein E4H36_02120 [Spirochaetales bacterium]|nr:MAG: hypothetical protein E4H36_02120 [Spirochaetales bacterium]